MASRVDSRLVRWSSAVLLAALVAAVPLAFGQGRAGPLIFLARRPPRDLTGNIRGWCNSNRVASYQEDPQSHLWRVQFMAFFTRAPNAHEIILTWWHIERGGQRTYVSNEPISMGNPSERIFFFNTSLRRAVGQFQPQERYEAVLTVEGSRGATELARGRVELTGEIERHSGVVDFTQPSPTPR